MYMDVRLILYTLGALDQLLIFAVETVYNRQTGHPFLTRPGKFRLNADQVYSGTQLKP